jgi:hypothetical protein
VFGIHIGMDLKNKSCESFSSGCTVLLSLSFARGVGAMLTKQSRSSLTPKLLRQIQRIPVVNFLPGMPLYQIQGIHPVPVQVHPANYWQPFPYKFIQVARIKIGYLYCIFNILPWISRKKVYIFFPDVVDPFKIITHSNRKT